VTGAKERFGPFEERDIATGRVANRIADALDTPPVVVDQLLRRLLPTGRRSDGENVLLDLREIPRTERHHLGRLWKISQGSNELIA